MCTCTEAWSQASPNVESVWERLSVVVAHVFSDRVNSDGGLHVEYQIQTIVM